MNQPKEKILIVEDERLVAKDIESFLSSRGYSVPAVLASGEEAVRAALEIKPDLVLMDVKLKGALDGIEASRLIRKELDIPVIFLTAYGSEDLVRRAGEVSTYGYLLKPFNETQLEINVEMALSRHRLEREMRERQQYLAQVLDGNPIATLVIDREHRLVLWNRACEILTAVPREQVLGKSIDSTIFYSNERRPVLADLVLEMDTEAMKSLYGDRDVVPGPDIPESYTAADWLTINGVPRFLRFLAARLHDEQGQVIGAIETLQDRTEQKRTEEEFRQLSQRQTLILQSVGEGICGLDMEGKITFINQAGERLLGWTAEEVIGRDQHALIHHSRPDGSPYAPHECPIRQSLTDGSRCQFTKGTFIKKDGTSLPVEYSSTPILEEGRIIGAVVTFKDISGREFLEKQVQQAQKLEAIGTLAGGIAHDFNNILSAVLGFTEISLLDVPEGSKLRRNLDQVLQAGQRARDLVKQILAFSRQDDSERQPVELHRLIQEMVKLLRATLPATIEIRSGLQAVGLVMADPTQIHQVLINLCTNAAQAIGPRKGVIAVTLDEVIFEAGGPLPHPDLKPGRYQCLTVSDTGPGIDPDDRDRIFDPFFTTKSLGEGTGLGLSVSFGIIRKHGGTITVASEPGKGTTFRVYLPLMKKAVAVRTPLREIPVNGPGRILLVDDEESLASVGRLMLERAGYQVTALTDPQEALQVFKTCPDEFNLVITDQTMPGMTGEELVRKIFILRPDIPVILCTGYSDGLNERRAEAQGIRKLLLKPLEMQGLLDTVARLLSDPGIPISTPPLHLLGLSNG